jgi:Holliday junction resolvasome RuvABC endonuclease subunit
MNRKHVRGPILAVHPASHGLGWALFERPLALSDFGITSAKGNRSGKYLERFAELLDGYKPSVLVLEKVSKEDARHSNRIHELEEAMRGMANSRGIEIHTYDRGEVGLVVTGNEKATRHEIAVAVSEQVPIPRSRLPKKRKLWEPEHHRQCLFDAAALGITHIHLVEGQKAA